MTQVDDTRLMDADDRQLLPSELKRNDVLTLWEVQRYGSDSFGDPEYMVHPRAETPRLVP
ncbi:MAG TPA: hypothetical protein VG276_02870 [Actinomycetes bacterium]|nr:hypothetical protein [Actinomycetes bacterium]